MADSGAAGSINRAWQMGFAIEAGIDEQEARSRIDAGEIIAPAASLAAGGIVAASATGLGGVGLAMAGTAIGVSAAAAVAAPAVAAGAVGYGIYRGIKGLKNRNRDQAVRALVDYLRATNREDMADKVFWLEGKGRLDTHRRPPTHASAKATFQLFTETSTNALVGLFGSPEGELVVTFDVNENHWAFVRLIGEDSFSGGGVDLRGRQLRVDDLDSIDILLRVLEREGFVSQTEDSSEAS